MVPIRGSAAVAGVAVPRRGCFQTRYHPLRTTSSPAARNSGKVPRMENAPSKTLTILGCLVGIGVIGALDKFTGFDLELYPLYFLPVGVAAWRVSQLAARVLAAVSAAVWYVANSAGGVIEGGAFVASSATFFRAGANLVAFATIAILVSELRRRQLATIEAGSEAETSGNDALTSLANRPAFYERAENIVAMARRAGTSFSLAYLNLDDFKRHNEEHGEKAGDLALQEVASVLQRSTRTSDLIARMGGDEFAVLLTDTDVATTNLTLERIRTGLAQTMAERKWTLTASIGAVCFSKAPASLEQAVRSADALMFRVKSAGKNRLELEVADVETGGPGAAPARTPIPPLPEGQG